MKTNQIIAAIAILVCMIALTFTQDPYKLPKNQPTSTETMVFAEDGSLVPMDYWGDQLESHEYIVKSFNQDEVFALKIGGVGHEGVVLLQSRVDFKLYRGQKIEVVFEKDVPDSIVQVKEVFNNGI